MGRLCWCVWMHRICVGGRTPAPPPPHAHLSHPNPETHPPFPPNKGVGHSPSGGLMAAEMVHMENGTHKDGHGGAIPSGSPRNASSGSGGGGAVHYHHSSAGAYGKVGVDFLLWFCVYIWACDDPSMHGPTN